MALFLVPYNNSMRLEKTDFDRFNSFTQEICIDNAVVGLTDPDDSQPIVPNAGTYVPIATDPASAPPVKDVGTKKSVQQMLGDEEGAIISKYPSQVVAYSSKYISKLSDVSKDLNVSGSLSIRYGEISGGGSGSYVNTEAFQNSDMNFLITVTVVNQTINVKDQLQFWPVNNKKPGDYTSKSLTETYGDSFISGFQEGGTFTAMVSIKALDKSSMTAIQADAHVALQIGVGSVEAQAAVKLAEKNLATNAETTITVNWSGGGQLKEGSDEWTIETLKSVAARFPDLVAACPQRTHAILTKYTALRGYIQWRDNVDLSPLDFEVANLYTSELLDVYMGYKSVWRDIHTMIDDFNAGKLDLVVAPTPPTPITTPMTPATTPGGAAGPGKALTPFSADLFGLDQGLQTCRALMVRIVAENDAISKNPALAVDKDRPVAYLRPGIFRQLLPQPATEALSTHMFAATYGFGEVGGNNALGGMQWAAQSVIPQCIPMFSKLDQTRNPSTSSISSFASIYEATLTGGRLLQTGSYRYAGRCSMLAVPKNDQGIFVNVVSFPDRTPAPAPSTVAPAPAAIPAPTLVSSRQHVDFPYAYDNVPSVVGFLAGYDTDAAGYTNVCINIENITTSGFDIVAVAIDSLRRVSASWFACPSDLKGVRCGSSPALWTTQGGNALASAQAKSSFSDRVFHPPHLFARAPRTVVGVRGFSLTAAPINLRLDVSAVNETKRGFDWQAVSWADTQMTNASVSWISWDSSFT